MNSIESAKKHVKVLTWLIDGEVLQFFNEDEGVWENRVSSVLPDPDYFKYRIKPKVVYGNTYKSDIGLATAVCIHDSLEDAQCNLSSGGKTYKMEEL